MEVYDRVHQSCQLKPSITMQLLEVAANLKLLQLVKHLVFCKMKIRILLDTLTQNQLFFSPFSQMHIAEFNITPSNN